MTSKRESKRTNARVVPQVRLEGSGEGRKLFPWKREYPWLVIAAEQVCVAAAGSEGALLEDRDWVANWRLTPSRIRQELEHLFPGIGRHLDDLWNGETSWEANLKNRVYKMYYSGTSDRGESHDPKTRATISSEHWRYWSARDQWEPKILPIVFKQLVCRCWRNWL